MIKELIFKLCNKILNRDIHYAADIPASYLFETVLNRGCMMIRGGVRKLRFGKSGRLFFCGKHVMIKCSKKLMIGSGVSIKDGVRIDALSKDGVIIGNNVSIGENSIIMCSGSIAEIGKGLKIGDNTGIAHNCFFGAAGGIEIGEDVAMGQNVRFHAENHVFSDPNKLIKEQGVNHKGIKVGNNCWIGSGAVFLDGAEVGEGCVVGANAIVNKKFPENVVIVGMPAKIIGNRTIED